MLRETFGETDTHLTKVLFFIRGTRNSIGIHLRGIRATGTDQVAMETVHLAKDQPSVERVKGPTEIVGFCK